VQINNILSNQSGLSIIAEIGVNHEGSLKKAKEMIRLASSTGIDYIKLQSYTPTSYVASNDQGRLKRVAKFALTEQGFRDLERLASQSRVGFLSTPLTEDWVDILDSMCPAFKIASGDITFKPVIKKAARTGKPLLISTGAANLEEIDQAVEWVREEVGQGLLPERLILMHCVAAYPVPINEANLLSIPFLKERYGLTIGYSNHVVGIEAALAAVALGASVIEVHFTDQKEGREFRDHALSFDAQDLKTFVDMAQKIKQSLGDYTKTIQPCEVDMIPAIRKGIVAAKNIKAGTILSENDLKYARPATQFQAIEVGQLLGKEVTQDIEEGYLIPRDVIKCVA
jgi:N-acetylneuraminate synthase/N,N'-diacetyllegionaminate synthase